MFEFTGFVMRPVLWEDLRCYNFSGGGVKSDPNLKNYFVIHDFKMLPLWLNDNIFTEKLQICLSKAFWSVMKP